MEYRLQLGAFASEAFRLKPVLHAASSIVIEPYPVTASQRDRWILERRGPKASLDVFRPYTFLWEEEAGAQGELIPIAAMFLANREWPFICLMFDLWQKTL